MTNLYQYENELYLKGYNNIAGTDEAGRGPLAGPVVAAAVILPKGLIIEGINDSKKLSEKKREELSYIIKEKAVAYSIVFVDEKKIDEINIYEASRLAMIKAISSLKVKADYVLSDAMPINSLDVEVLPIIKGDAKSASIAASSILAKVARDHYMEKLDSKYPEYGFKKHKGYPTKAHIEAIKKYGVLDCHRKTYGPVREQLVIQLELDL